jgi:GTP-binding protein
MVPGCRDVKVYSEQVYRKLGFVDFAPLVFISAANGYGVHKIRAAIKNVAADYQRRIPTSALNQALRGIFARNAPPLAHGKPVKFFYATQVRSRPPSFVLFVSFAKGIAASYERYLIHQMRQALGLEASPIRLFIRGRREEPRTKGKRQKVKVLRKKS